jgi:hypothetical protein
MQMHRLSFRSEDVPKLTLISHHLCPYVQRAVIALREKRVPFERIDVDLANKPHGSIGCRRSAKRRSSRPAMWRFSRVP